MNTSFSRRGFSLVEVMVVLAIILILIGLLVPAVQRVRESAAQTVCRNNMKQIALAVLQYEVAYKKLPPAGTGYGWCCVDFFLPEPQGWIPVDFPSDPHIVNQSGLSLLLAYLGQEALDAGLDRTKAFSLAMSPYPGGPPTAPSGWNPNGSNPVQNGSSFTPADTDLTGNTNLALMSTQLAIFRCPSDPGDPVIPADVAPSTPFNGPYTPTYGVGGNFTGAKTSYDYVTNAGCETELCNSWGNPLVTPQYMFGQNSNCPIARVTDGMSNTFMLGETLFTTGHGQGTAWGYRSWDMVGIDPFAGINSWGPDGTIGTLPYSANPGSMHPGGCFFAMGDGSVRWVSQSVSPSVLLDMSTINGGIVADTE
jgi:prepilin-type N-terminal cleavage/methylation domain-containing protein